MIHYGQSRNRHTEASVGVQDTVDTLRGDFELRTQDGELTEPGRRTVALCGAVFAVKPFG
jgi:hypothetical protein